MQPKIEKGIPIPREDYGTPYRFLKQLKVGDSFVVESVSKVRMHLKNSVRHGVLITSRKVDGVGYRIWRIARKPTNRIVKIERGIPLPKAA